MPYVPIPIQYGPGVTFWIRMFPFLGGAWCAFVLYATWVQPRMTRKLCDTYSSTCSRSTPPCKSNCSLCKPRLSSHTHDCNTACVWLQHRLCLSRRYIRLLHSLCVYHTDIQGCNTACVSSTQIYKPPTQVCRLPAQLLSLWHRYMKPEHKKTSENAQKS